MVRFIWVSWSLCIGGRFVSFFEVLCHVPHCTKKSFAHWTKNINVDLLVFSQKMAIYVGFWFISEGIDTADPHTLLHVMHASFVIIVTMKFFIRMSSFWEGMKSNDVCWCCTNLVCVLMQPQFLVACKLFEQILQTQFIFILEVILHNWSQQGEVQQKEGANHFLFLWLEYSIKTSDAPLKHKTFAWKTSDASVLLILQWSIWDCL